MDDFLQKLKKVVWCIVLYGLAISQADCRKADPYQLPYNKDYNLYDDHEFLAGLSSLREEERRYLESVHTDTRPMPTPTSPFAPILSTSETHVYSDTTLPAVNPQEIFT